MDLTNIILITLASIDLFLGALIISGDHKTESNITYTIFVLAVVMWTIGIAFFRETNDYESLLLWNRVFVFAASIIAGSLLHFSLIFPYAKTKLTLFKKILIYLPSVLVFFAVITPGILIKDIVIRPWGNESILGWGYIYFGFYFSIFSIWSFLNLLIKYRKSIGIIRTRLSFVLAGLCISLVFGAVFNLYLILLGNYKLIWIGPYASFIMLVFIGYAIAKHQLMNIKIILTEFFVGLISILLFVEALISKTVYQQLYKWGIFFIFIYFGYLLIKSVLNEIKRGEELKKAYAKLDKLSRAKSEFLSIASHQLRTPLTAVKGYISLILEKNYGEVSEKMIQPLKNVFQSNERLLSLVNDLLNLSHLESGKIELTKSSVSLENLILNTVEELRINANKKGLYINIEKPSKLLPNIMADEDKLRQVILNIIDNAIKYTNNGGITIKMNATPLTEKIIISDTGTGITPEEKKNVFKMFTRATAVIKNHTAGFGVGLYVAKKFIDMHNGKVWIESQGSGKGTTLNIELPIK
ncbi:MAG: ATP-binding protein [Candidatus Nealsonbacteria bacterium]